MLQLARLKPCSVAIISATFSPIMTQGAWVLPGASFGWPEKNMTDDPWMDMEKIVKKAWLRKEYVIGLQAICIYLQGI